METPKCSEASGTSSASTRSAATPGVSSSSWDSTRSSTLQGSHQCAQKCTTAWGTGTVGAQAVGQGAQAKHGGELQQQAGAAASGGGQGRASASAASGLSRTRRWFSRACRSAASFVKLCMAADHDASRRFLCAEAQRRPEKDRASVQ